MDMYWLNGLFDFLSSYRYKKEGALFTTRRYLLTLTVMSILLSIAIYFQLIEESLFGTIIVLALVILPGITAAIIALSLRVKYQYPTFKIQTFFRENTHTVDEHTYAVGMIKGAKIVFKDDYLILSQIDLGSKALLQDLLVRHKLPVMEKDAKWLLSTLSIEDFSALNIKSTDSGKKYK